MDPDQKEQSDIDRYCLQYWLPKCSAKAEERADNSCQECWGKL